MKLLELFLNVFLNTFNWKSVEKIKRKKRLRLVFEDKIPSMKLKKIKYLKPSQIQ